MSGRFFSCVSLFVIVLVGLSEAGPRRVPFRVTKVNGRATCPNFTTKPDLVLDNYAGVWYEIQVTPNTFEADLTCIRAIYSKLAENAVEVVNTGVLPDGSVSIINGTATQISPEEPGRFVLSFPGRPDGDYNVIDTDYRTYTSIYSCDTLGSFLFEYAWIMSRENVMTEQSVQRAKDAFTAAGIDVSGKFQLSPHPANCFYYP